MEEHEAGGGWGYEGGDVGRGKLVDALEIPDTIISIIVTIARLYCEEGKRVHLSIGPLQLVHEIQTGMNDERVHVACLLTETGDTISALLGSAKFELEQRLVSGADDAEVVRHVCLPQNME